MMLISSNYRLIYVVITYASVCLMSVNTEISVELRDGFNSASGRVVLTINGTVGTLCGYRWWDNVDASVVCASLNYRLGFAVGDGVFKNGNEGMLVDDLRCVTTDNSLNDCDPTTFGVCSANAAAGVICANDWTEAYMVEIVNGTSPNLGKVEIVFDEENRTEVCSRYWENGDADVVCKMLNYSSGISVRNVYDRDSDWTLTDYFACSGNEEHLLDCSASLWWSGNCGDWHSHAAGVLCLSNSTDGFTLELVGGNTSYKGVVVFRSVYLNSTLRPGDMRAREASEICAHLGYRAGVGVRTSFFGIFQEKFELQDYDSSICVQTGGEQMIECRRAYITATNGNGHGAAVICIADGAKDVTVSLVNGSSLYEMSGRVMLTLYGEIDVYICDDYFDVTDASAVCRTFGYSYGVPFGGKYFGDSVKDGALFLRDFQCSQRTSTIEECLEYSYSSYLDSSCSFGYASVICHNGSYVPALSYIRVGGGCELGGFCEFKSDGLITWYQNMSMPQKSTAHTTFGNIMLGDFGDIRAELRNGTTPGTGMVYLYLDEFEGALTGYSWQNNVAATICKMLNYSSGVSTGLPYKSPNWQIMLSNINCGSGVSSITSCSFQAYGRVHQSTRYTATVACFGTDVDNSKQSMTFALEGGSGPNYGLVVVTISGHRGTMCTYYASANTVNIFADVGCREFGYTFGKVIHNANFDYGMELNPILFNVPSCSGSEKTINECDDNGLGSGRHCNHANDVGLFCSDKQFGTEACIQLVNGQSDTDGTLEVVVDGIPIPIAYTYWNRKTASWFCGALGFSNSSGSGSRVPNTKSLAFNPSTCDTSSHTSITDCLSGWSLRGNKPSSVIKLRCAPRNSDAGSLNETDSCLYGPNSCPPLSEWTFEDGVYSCKCQTGYEKSPQGNCEEPSTLRCLENGYANHFPYGDAQGDSSFTNNDDGCPKKIQFPFKVSIFGKKFKRAYVCSNGVVAFGSRYKSATPQASIYLRPRTILAPYFADIDLRKQSGGGKVYYQLYNAASTFDQLPGTEENLLSVLNLTEYYVQKIEGVMDFKASLVFIATWDEVQPFGDVQDSEKATFQLVLVTDGTKTYTMYIYGKCLMKWRKHRRVLIGFSSHLDIKQNENSFQATALTMDRYVRTKGIKGLLFYKLTYDEDDTPNYDGICLQWHAENVKDKRYIEQQMDFMQGCPCNMVLLNLDFWYISHSESGNKVCAKLRSWRRFSYHGKTCCYNKRTGAFITSYTKAGSFQKYHPDTHARENRLYDVQMRSYCCVKSEMGLCNKYFDVRPIGKCYSTYPFRPAWFWGDPHIKTLDGKSYTFNGHGEYTMLRFKGDTDQLILQARMERTTNKNGNLTDATVFTAFAAQDDTSRVQVELNRNKTKMVIYANGRDYSNNFYDSENFTLSTHFLDLTRQDDRVIALFKASGISFETFIVMDMMLQFAITVPTIHQNLVEGLLGNYDNITENDFVYPNGTTLSGNSSDREIFSFGQAWMADESTTIFQCEPGRGNSDFTDITFIPFFMDEANQTQIAIAEQLCNKTNLPCMYDYLSTQNKDVAISTLGTDETTYEIVEQMQNEIPTISGPGLVLLTVGQEVEIIVAGSDDGVFQYVLTDDTDIAVTLDTLVDGSGRVVWIPTSSDPVTLGVSIVDDHGLVASPAEFQFLLCSGCSNHGSCNFNETREDNRTTPMFSYATCECDLLWEGEDCEIDFDGCEEAPCHPQRQCFDYNATMHETLNVSYWCSPCPNGMVEDQEGKCIDIDECTNGAHNCQQICVNTEMSFECSCRDGYRQRSADPSKCDDIDECSEYLGRCSQVCINLEGNYTCGCYEGFVYTSNNTCKRVSDPCKGLNHNCVNTTGCILVQGVPTCFCSNGYYQSLDEASCVDINECELDVCQQGCNNTEGGYECYCYTGYLLSPLGTECIACPFPLYGENCEHECTCGRGSNVCNHIKGCVCDPGWTGTDCDDDVDECAEDPFACDLLVQKCVNSAGSYSCQCKDGYELNSEGNCVDIDECSDVELNTCTDVCDNIYGTYICKCGTGYVPDPNNETSCIDINECVTGLSDCEHICVNQEGSYNCQCHPGFTLLDDRKNCVKFEDVCEEKSNLTCSHICTLNEDSTARCECPLGLQLFTDNINCVDINECASNETNLCSNQSLCTNTFPRYACSCEIGFKLENDGITCKECDEFHYGQNCEHECNCGPGAVTCDKVSGCICTTGWLGEACTTDVDECGSSPCDAANNFVCRNTPGSYYCVCALGHSVTPDGGCIDDDECTRASEACPHHSVCTNSIGSYSCTCLDSFQLSRSGLCVPAALSLVEFISRLHVTTSRKKRSTVSAQDVEDMSYLNPYLGDALASVTVISMSETSTYITVTFELLLNGSTSTSQLLTQAVVSFYNDGYTYGGTSYTMEDFSVGGITVSGSSVIDTCAVFQAIIDSCEVGNTCEVIDNLPVCRSQGSIDSSDSDGQGLTIGLAVGISTALLAMIGVVVFIYYKKKHGPSSKSSGLNSSKVSVMEDDNHIRHALETAMPNKPTLGPYRHFQSGEKRPVSGRTETQTPSRPVSASGLSFDMFVTDFGTDNPTKTIQEQVSQATSSDQDDELY